MDRPNGYDSVYVGGGRKMKRYLVYIDNIFYGETTAVSPEKAANNIRYQIYEESTGWLDVPPIEAFDCVEI